LQRTFGIIYDLTMQTGLHLQLGLFEVLYLESNYHYIVYIDINFNFKEFFLSPKIERKEN